MVTFSHSKDGMNKRFFTLQCRYFGSSTYIVLCKIFIRHNPIVNNLEVNSS